MQRSIGLVSCVAIAAMAGVVQASVGVSFSDSDGLLDATSTIAGPGQSFTVAINLSITAGEVVGGLTLLPKVDKPSVLKMSGRSIISAVLSDPTADVVASPTLNPQSLVDAGVTTANVNLGVNASQAVMLLTLTVDPATPASAYPIVLSFGKARWATIGQNSVSAAADSGAVYTIFPPCTSPPVVQAAASRRTHGAAGDFDIDLPAVGPVGVECRQGGPARIVVTYDKAVAGSIVVTPSVGAVGSATTAGNKLTIPVSGVPDGACLSLTINGVACQGNPGQVAPAHTVKLRSLFGDVSASGGVDAGDIGLVKLQSLKPITISNFRMDVSVDGGIDAGDIGMVKLRSLKIVPDPCSN